MDHDDKIKNQINSTGLGNNNNNQNNSKDLYQNEKHDKLKPNTDDKD
jgi:hypothetical protein